MYNFISLIQGKRVLLEEKDKMVLKLSKDEHFSVKSLYGVLEGIMATIFPRKVIWNS